MPPISPRSVERTLPERLRYFQRRELSLEETLGTQFWEYFETYQEELDRYFYKHFVVPYPEREARRTPEWDLVRASQLLAVPTLESEFRVGLDAVVEEAEEALDDDLVAMYVEGYELALWELHLSGVDVSNAEGAGDAIAALLLLLASGVGGVTYRQRLGSWAAQGSTAVGQALRTSVAGELTLADTRGLIDPALRLVVNGVTSLGSNELWQAMMLGASQAYGEFGAVEVWWTAEDEDVCPICAPLHNTVTRLRPVYDTHPACRCWKVPLASAPAARPSYVSFESFSANQRQ